MKRSKYFGCDCEILSLIYILYSAVNPRQDPLLMTTNSDIRFNDNLIQFPGVESIFSALRHSIPNPANPTVWFRGRVPEGIVHHAQTLLNKWPVLGGRIKQHGCCMKHWQVIVEPHSFSMGLIELRDLDFDEVKAAIDWEDPSKPEPLLINDNDQIKLQAKPLQYMSFLDSGPIVTLVLLETKKGPNEEQFWGLAFAVNHIVGDVRVSFDLLKNLEKVMTGEEPDSLVVNFGIASKFWEHREKTESENTPEVPNFKEIDWTSIPSQCRIEQTPAPRPHDITRTFVQRGTLENAMRKWSEVLGPGVKFSQNDVLMATVQHSSQEVSRFLMEYTLRARVSDPKEETQNPPPVSVFGMQTVNVAFTLPPGFTHLQPDMTRRTTMAFLKDEHLAGMRVDSFLDKARLAMQDTFKIAFLNNWQSQQYWPKKSGPFGKAVMQTRDVLDITSGGSKKSTTDMNRGVFVMDRKPEMPFIISRGIGLL